MTARNDRAALEAQLKATIRDVPDFPKPGIIFKDISTILDNAELMRSTIGFFLERYRDKHIDTVVAIESRGFIFGAPLAYELGASLHMARKKGKLPYTTIEQTYDLEYGSATIELHTDAIGPDERVLIIDDLLATGGTAGATASLVAQQGGSVVECAFVIELAFLNGREKLPQQEICSLVRY